MEEYFASSRYACEHKVSFGTVYHRDCIYLCQIWLVFGFLIGLFVRVGSHGLMNEILGPRCVELATKPERCVAKLEVVHSRDGWVDDCGLQG